MTLQRKGQLIPLKIYFLASSLLTLVPSCLSMHLQWEGLRCKKKMQVREMWMTHWRDYISHNHCECSEYPKKELENVVGGKLAGIQEDA